MSATGPFDGPRDFPYIKPMGRRVSEYEALNLFVQPIETSMEHPVAKRSGWPADSTQLRSVDWYAFRDPAQRWQRPYLKRQAEQERGIDRALHTAIDTGRINRLDPAWVDAVIGDVYLTSAYFERGLFRALFHAGGVALSDTLGVALIFNAVDKERHAQDIVFYHYDLVANQVATDDGDRRPLWLDDPAFQGMRRVIERLNASSDWAEISLVANLVIEPLLGRFFFNELLWKQCAVHDDVTTPALLVEAENDRNCNINAMVALARMLVDDAEHGAHNRAVLGQWIREWYDDTVEAVSSLAPLARRLEIDFDVAWGLVEAGWRARLDGVLSELPVRVN